VVVPLIVAVAVGFTVMVKVSTVPTHPLAVGVTEMLAVIGPFVPLVGVNAGIFPEPLAASPIAGLLFVQAKVVPATGPEKLMPENGAALHKVKSATVFTVAVGCTVMVAVPETELVQVGAD
jgi:hypothetical protein